MTRTCSRQQGEPVQRPCGKKEHRVMKELKGGQWVEERQLKAGAGAGTRGGPWGDRQSQVIQGTRNVCEPI